MRAQLPPPPAAHAGLLPSRSKSRVRCPTRKIQVNRETWTVVRIEQASSFLSATGDDGFARNRHHHFMHCEADLPIARVARTSQRMRR